MVGVVVPETSHPPYSPQGLRLEALGRNYDVRTDVKRHTASRSRCKVCAVCELYQIVREQFLLKPEKSENCLSLLARD